MSKPTKIKTPYWIISSRKRGSIWGYPYISKVECHNEFKHQMDNLKQLKGEEFMKNVDWKIEEHYYERSEESQADKDFKSF